MPTFNVIVPEGREQSLQCARLGSVADRRALRRCGGASRRVLPRRAGPEAADGRFHAVRSVDLPRIGIRHAGLRRRRAGHDLLSAAVPAERIPSLAGDGGVGDVAFRLADVPHAASRCRAGASLFRAHPADRRINDDRDRQPAAVGARALLLVLSCIPSRHAGRRCRRRAPPPMLNGTKTSACLVPCFAVLLLIFFRSHLSIPL